ncbi:unnamed protein product [Moneuplotes crassus]|uniref:Uncharacterized protein n=1 Tax=Euplotes crassus TaxID=5936 RepID=A0AAD1Y8J4_EUPCR|nr:unnamed protein product [Moneuplotes crassus]
MCDISDLKILGIGFPLYFQLKKFMMILYVGLFIVVCLPCCYFNFIEASRTDSTYRFLSALTIGVHSVQSLNDDPDLIFPQLMLNSSAIVMVALLALCFRCFQNKMIKKSGIDPLFAESYNLMVSGIPKEATQEEIQKGFEKVFPREHAIQQPVLCYDIPKLMKFANPAYKQKRKCFFFFKSGKPIKNLDEEMELVANKLARVEHRDEVLHEYFTGHVILPFNKIADAYYCYEVYNPNLTALLYQYLSKLLSCCKRDIKKIKIRGKTVTVKLAPSPNDLIWENIATRACNRFFRILVSSLLTLIVLGVSVGVNYSLTLWGDSLERDESSRSWAFMMNVLSSCVTIFFNEIMSLMITYLSKYEKSQTYTVFHLSMAIKISVFSYLNTVVIPIIIHINRINWFDSEGLITTITFNMLLISFLDPIMFGISLKSVKDWLIKWYSHMKSDLNLTQEQINKIREPREIEIYKKYANTTLLVSMTLTFMFMYPYIIVFAFFGNILQYAVEKLVLVRFCKIPQNIGPLIAKNFIYAIPIMLFLHSLVTFYVHYRLTDDIENSVIPLLTSAVILPLTYLLFGCFSRVIDYNGGDQNRQMKILFKYDFDTSNPVTMHAQRMKKNLLQMAVQGCSQELIVQRTRELMHRPQLFLNDAVSMRKFWKRILELRKSYQGRHLEREDLIDFAINISDILDGCEINEPVRPLQDRPPAIEEEKINLSHSEENNEDSNVTQNGINQEPQLDRGQRRFHIQNAIRRNQSDRFDSSLGNSLDESSQEADISLGVRPEGAQVERREEKKEFINSEESSMDGLRANGQIIHELFKDGHSSTTIASQNGRIREGFSQRITEETKQTCIGLEGNPYQDDLDGESDPAEIDQFPNNPVFEREICLVRNAIKAAADISEPSEYAPSNTE